MRPAKNGCAAAFSRPLSRLEWQLMGSFAPHEATPTYGSSAHGQWRWVVSTSARAYRHRARRFPREVIRYDTPWGYRTVAFLLGSGWNVTPLGPTFRFAGKAATVTTTEDTKVAVIAAPEDLGADGAADRRRDVAVKGQGERKRGNPLPTPSISFGFQSTNPPVVCVSAVWRHRPRSEGSVPRGGGASRHTAVEATRNFDDDSD